MLNSELRKKIETEVEAERYRESLQPQLGQKERAWKFLNSSFGLWFLSAIVVSGITAATTSYLQLQQEARVKQALDLTLRETLAMRYLRMYEASHGYPNDEAFGVFVAENEPQYLSLFLATQQRNDSDDDIGHYLSIETSQLMLRFELGDYSEQTKRLAGNVRKIAVATEVAVRVGNFRNDASRAQYLAGKFSAIRRETRELLRSLDFQGSFHPESDEEYWNPNFGSRIK
jgi:hypothetical protein